MAAVPAFHWKVALLPVNVEPGVGDVIIAGGCARAVLKQMISRLTTMLIERVDIWFCSLLHRVRKEVAPNGVL